MINIHNYKFTKIHPSIELQSCKIIVTYTALLLCITIQTEAKTT